MSNRIESYKAKIARLRRERDLLADRVRLLEPEPGYDSSGLSDTISDGMADASDGENRKPKDRPKKKKIKLEGPESIDLSSIPPEVLQQHLVSMGIFQNHHGTMLSSSAALAPSASSAPYRAASPQTPSEAAEGKKRPVKTPKELKAPKATKEAKAPSAKSLKPKKAMEIPRDEQGRPRFPVQVGVFTVHSLGTVVLDRDGFHNERYVFPVGYRVSRTFASTVDPNKAVEYFCSIEDGGGDSPVFRVEPSDAPENTTVATSPTGAWSSIIKSECMVVLHQSFLSSIQCKQTPLPFPFLILFSLSAANAIRSKEASSSSGPENFGFTNPTIQFLIQELPGVSHLRKYEHQNFEMVPLKLPTKRSARGKGNKKDEEGEEEGEEQDEEDELVGEGSGIGSEED